MPSTAKLCIWVPRRWLDRLEELGRENGTTPAGYVRILVDEAVGGQDTGCPSGCTPQDICPDPWHHGSSGTQKD